jgi:Alpha galactosidase A/Alpha galactosidase C-terminal beta sandwich domain/NPCBM-associated, NEW3 domain of alpha-galactosidase
VRTPHLPGHHRGHPPAHPGRHRRPRARLSALAAVLLLLGLSPVLATATAPPALALNNGLARTPPMGWDDWNAFGCQNDAADMEANAQYVHDSGLQADGYTYVINDGCWNDIVGVDPTLYPSGQATPAQPDPGGGPEATLPTTAEEAACGVVNGRGTGQPGTSGYSVPAGQLFINPYLFPPSSECANDGLKIVASYIHSLGLKFGLWLDASDTWNGEEIPGSYGPCSNCSVPTYDAEDAGTFASWGVDYIKADWAGDTTTAPGNDPMPYGGTDFADQGGPLSGLNDEQMAQTMYGALSTAVQATGRPMVLNLCVHNPLAYVQTWGAGVGNSWKSDANLSDSWSSLVSMVNDVDQYAQYAGPGGWNDPDMLEVGNGGMTQTEDESEFSLWAEMSAPLIMGSNMATPDEVTAAETRTGISQELPAATPAQDTYDMSIFGNKNVIAVDQDPLGQQAHIVSFDGTHLVLAKPLAGGDVALTLFNEGDAAAEMSTSVQAIGMQAHSPVYTLKDLWSNKVTETAGAISAFVQPHQTVMYRVSAPRGPGAVLAALASAPNTTLAVTSASNPVSAGGPASVTVSLTNNGATPIATTSDLGLAVPSGWTAQGPAQRQRILTKGDTDSVAFTVAPPAAAQPIDSATFTGSAGYYDVAGAETASAPLTLPFVAPVTGPYRVADNTQGPPPAIFGELSGDFGISAAGAGINPAGRHPASDQYATIYLPGGADSSAVATAQVTAVASGRGPQAGLLIRNDATGSGPEGVALYLNGSGQVVMSWAAAGGTTVDSSQIATGAPGTGTWLQLARTGANTYSGFYSTTSQNGPWTLVDSVTASGAAQTQDVGLFADSGSAYAPVTAGFGGFTVTG